MKKLFTFLASLLFLFSAHATLYTGTLNSATGVAGSTVKVSFNLTSGPALSELVIYSSILGTVTPLTTTDNPVFGVYGNNYTATFTVPAGYPNGTPVFFTISTNPFGTVYGNASPFPMYTILPVTFISNSAKYVEAESKVVLNWKIATTDGVKEFKIMRSTDGLNFTTIGTVLPGVKTDYVYEDVLPNTSINYYYKISGVTIDGAVKETSRMLIKKTDKNATPVILNNGNIKNELLITGINLMNYKAGEIKVFDVTGRSYAATIQSSNSIYVTALSAGMYFLKIKDLPAISFMER
jgi:hypothetical protein